MEFKDSEIVSINGQQYPKIGGKLRLALEANEKISLSSEIVLDETERAVVKSIFQLDHGSFCGFGSANTTEDRDLSGSLIELAQTRSIARALRFAGYGIEVCGVEELRGDLSVKDVASSEGKPARTQLSSANSEGTVSKITAPQAKLIGRMIEKLELSQPQFESILSQRFKRQKLSELSKREASDLIDLLHLMAKQRKEEDLGGDDSMPGGTVTH